MDINITPQTVYKHLLSPFNSEIENLQIDITEEKTKHIAIAAFVVVGSFFFAIVAGSTTGLLFSFGLGVISLYFTTGMTKIGVYLNRLETSVQKAGIIPRPLVEKSSGSAHTQIPRPVKRNSLPELNKVQPKQDMPLPPTSLEKKTVIIKAAEEVKVENKPKLAPRVTARLLSEAKYKEELNKKEDFNREIDAQGNTLLHYALLFDDLTAINQIEKTPGVILNPENKLKETPESFAKKHKRTKPADLPIIKPVEVHAPAKPKEPDLPIPKTALISQDAVHQAYDDSKRANDVLEDKYGNTLLHFAALYKNLDTAFDDMYSRLKQELENEALEEKKNKLGQTPDEFAESIKNISRSKKSVKSILQT